DPHRGGVRALRRTPGSRLRRRAGADGPTLLHQFLRGRPRAGAVTEGAEEETGVGNWTIRQLDDMDDVLGDYPGEMYMATYAVDAEQVALTYRRMPAQTG